MFEKPPPSCTVLRLSAGAVEQSRKSPVPVIWCKDTWGKASFSVLPGSPQTQSITWQLPLDLAYNRTLQLKNLSGSHPIYFPAQDRIIYCSVISDRCFFSSLFLKAFNDGDTTLCLLFFQQNNSNSCILSFSNIFSRLLTFLLDLFQSSLKCGAPNLAQYSRWCFVLEEANKRVTMSCQHLTFCWIYSKLV